MKINAFWLMLGALGVYAIAYRFYSGFIARSVVCLDDARPTPAHTMGTGRTTTRRTSGCCGAITSRPSREPGR